MHDQETIKCLKTIDENLFGIGGLPDYILKTLADWIQAALKLFNVNGWSGYVNKHKFMYNSIALVLSFLVINGMIVLQIGEMLQDMFETI